MRREQELRLLSVLDVAILRTREDVERLFKARAKRYHPDNKSTGDEVKFLDLTASLRDFRKGAPKFPIKRERTAVAIVQSGIGKALADAKNHRAAIKAEADQEFGAYMAQMKETKFASDLNKKLEKEAGAMVLKIHGNAMQESGWPDLQIYSPHFTGHLELKVDSNKLSGLQAEKIRGLRERGVMACCAREMPTGHIRLENTNGTVIGLSCEPWRQMGAIHLLAWFSEINRPVGD